eukprot:TRINITY_DN15399_c0_g1::TRINITY_DN15399_c0_g1_i1::g.22799::m.22799 TRINITY_DN15399_c0_g1::TRINITY_DN15399_c0_g1_i1::g.22799  ORF type:complete len:296 (-),score=17.78,ASC/PF00858.19/0.00037,ASC/PF00858.19/2.9e+02,ASC/PF00858.19/1.4e+02,DUF4454/PF14628.1/9.6e+02,DUF4454/PF14628.1/0.09 TRINITY_DN15399_c0_g1_i1:69-956(-)
MGAKSRVQCLELFFALICAAPLVTFYAFHTLQYQDRPDMYIVELEREDSLAFPAVTVCNSLANATWENVACRRSTSQNYILDCSTDISKPAYLASPYDSWKCETFNYGLWEKSTQANQVFGLMFKANISSYQPAQYMGLHVTFHHNGSLYADANNLQDPGVFWLVPGGVYTQLYVKKEVYSEYEGSTRVDYTAYPSFATIRQGGLSASDTMVYVDFDIKYTADLISHYKKYPWKTIYEHVSTFGGWWAICFGVGVFPFMRRRVMPHVYALWEMCLPLDNDVTHRIEFGKKEKRHN